MIIENFYKFWLEKMEKYLQDFLDKIFQHDI